jgi:hypothetical protein
VYNKNMKAINLIDWAEEYDKLLNESADEGMFHMAKLTSHTDKLLTFLSSFPKKDLELVLAFLLICSSDPEERKFLGGRINSICNAIRTGIYNSQFYDETINDF